MVFEKMDYINIAILNTEILYKEGTGLIPVPA